MNTAENLWEEFEDSLKSITDAYMIINKAEKLGYYSLAENMKAAI